MENKDYKKLYEELRNQIKENSNKNDKIFEYILNKNNITEDNAYSIIKKLNKNQVINYHNILEKILEKWKLKDKKPKILLHSCCAPCSTHSLEYLCNYADVTILFSNSNIHPKSEYIKRSEAQKKFITDFNLSTNNNVEYIEDEYKPKDFIKKTIELKDEIEGGKRCDTCFQMRLDKAAIYAKNLGFDYFGTAITLSPKKNSKKINEIGFEMQEIYDVNYLPTDFKKNGGYKRSVEMCNEYDIYRQCYCGCVFALNNSKK